MTAERELAYGLDDRDLALKLRDLSELPWAVLHLNDYTRPFAANIVEVYVRYGALTWKQRKLARRLVTELLERQARRADTMTLVPRG